ncbi:hypothetical protein A3844_04170 [Paenibacillus helianthi]|uniref:Uncharacterized protein n=1 Tax=Paenibacillus helianthi TaxID=1349432 RepID=A0ABX3EVL5_9BACL|nr:hypothetical protein A3842_24740 [Paenibacillus sp. P3E]OKP89865.1 hypothetical protein A3848_13890 [Paenibacillus sp. P32E]OKP91049.1 hypothetical protein A3844_04170 [Paenibacillus helianthi]
MNPRLREYYDRKRVKESPTKIALIDCANKLLDHVYAIFRKGNPTLFSFINFYLMEVHSLCVQQYN